MHPKSRSIFQNVFIFDWQFTQILRTQTNNVYQTKCPPLWSTSYIPVTFSDNPSSYCETNVPLESIPRQAIFLSGDFVPLDSSGVTQGRSRNIGRYKKIFSAGILFSSKCQLLEKSQAALIYHSFRRKC